MLRLKLILRRLGAEQQHLGVHLRLSAAKTAQWINHEEWPRRDSAELREQVTAWLKARGALPEELATWWQPLPEDEARHLIGPARGRGKRAGVRDHSEVTSDTPPEDTVMLLRGQKLTDVARKHFALFRDPFRGEIRVHEDLFITLDARYCREAMWQTALHGGMTAIVGESGSGKTTLREDLAERIGAEGEAVLLITPYVIDMEERTAKRRTLGARDIASAIVHSLAPHQSVRQDGQARFLQVHRLLADSYRSGNKHCLVIEEAHDLPTATLRHLKRYLELKEGFQPLLSVVLLGQPELGHRLSELDASIREIVQRCEVVHLRPLDGALEPFLAHKLARAGKRLDEVITPDGLDAIRARLTIDTGRGRASTGPVSLLYPLAVQNLLTAALNQAAELGLPQVSADIVREV